MQTISVQRPVENKHDVKYPTPLMKILLVFACPIGASSLRLQNEERAIREAIRSGKRVQHVSIDALPACTVDDLSGHLLQHKNCYHLIHFSGHADRVNFLIRNFQGRIVSEALSHLDDCSLRSPPVLKHLESSAERLMQNFECSLTNSLKVALNPTDGTDSYPFAVDDLPLRSKSGENILFSKSHSYSHKELLEMGVGSLAFEGSNGHPVFVSTAAFANLLSQQHSLQCVILNACGSGIQGDLLRKVIPMTVCFNGKVSDVESISFSRGFYNALVNGCGFPECFAEGCRRIELSGMQPGSPRRKGPVDFAQLLVNEELMAVRPSQHFRSYNAGILPMQHNGSHVSDVNNASNSDLLSTHHGSLVDWNGSSVREAISSLSTELVNTTVTTVDQVLQQENLRLKSMIAMGMELLKSKDNEINLLKLQNMQLVKEASLVASHQEKGDAQIMELSDEQFAQFYLSSTQQLAINMAKAGMTGKKRRGDPKRMFYRSTASSVRNAQIGAQQRKKLSSCIKKFAFGSTSSNLDDINESGVCIDVKAPSPPPNSVSPNSSNSRKSMSGKPGVSDFDKSSGFCDNSINSNGRRASSGRSQQSIRFTFSDEDVMGNAPSKTPNSQSDKSITEADNSISGVVGAVGVSPSGSSSNSTLTSELCTESIYSDLGPTGLEGEEFLQKEQASVHFNESQARRSNNLSSNNSNSNATKKEKSVERAKASLPLSLKRPKSASRYEFSAVRGERSSSHQSTLNATSKDDMELPLGQGIAFGHFEFSPRGSDNDTLVAQKESEDKENKSHPEASVNEAVVSAVMESVPKPRHEQYHKQQQPHQHQSQNQITRVKKLSSGNSISNNNTSSVLTSPTRVNVRARRSSIGVASRNSKSIDESIVETSANIELLDVAEAGDSEKAKSNPKLSVAWVSDAELGSSGELKVQRSSVKSAAFSQSSNKQPPTMTQPSSASARKPRQHSSEAFREFLKERREAMKPSAAFASNVKRFEPVGTSTSNNSAGSGLSNSLPLPLQSSSGKL